MLVYNQQDLVYTSQINRIRLLIQSHLFCFIVKVYSHLHIVSSPSST